MPPKKLKQQLLEVPPLPERTREEQIQDEFEAELEKCRQRELIKQLPYVAFMAAIEHKHFDYVKQRLLEYEIGQYIIAKETTTQSHKETNGEHFHFIVQMTDQTYHNFSKSVFKDKFKLRGKAEKDKPRQYGRVSAIENQDHMIAYTIKDGNIDTNFTEEELIKYKAKSFQKKEVKEANDLVYNYIHENLDYRHYVGKQQIGVLIIQYHQVNKTKQTMTRNYINNMTYNYMTYHGPTNECGFSPLDIYNSIMGN